MKKIQLEIIGIFANHLQETSFTLLLGEIAGERNLPIMIGISEAQSIALALEGNTLDRPIMHDLFKEMLIKSGYFVHSITITEIKNDIFFAQIRILHEHNNAIAFTLDARPSDAIVIALRFHAPLLVSEPLLNELGSTVITKTELPDQEHVLNIQNKFDENQLITNFEPYSMMEIKRLLAEALEKEHYEQAALIRDEIKRRSQ